MINGSDGRTGRGYMEDSGGGGGSIGGGGWVWLI